MTMKYFMSETRRFLKAAHPEVMCVTGRWGVGKTFGWNFSLATTIKEKNLALSKYAYVSLFGRNSIEDVKMAIVENTNEGEALGKQPTAPTFWKHIDRLKNFAMEKSNLVNIIPGASDYAPALNRLLFMNVREQIICLDDLERMGSGIETKQILGLVSELKEQKNCKIVLLLNRDAMDDKDRKTLNEQIEKVADFFLEFTPTSAEAVEIALEKNSRFHESLRDSCLRLNLLNIRVIKRIEQICYRIDAVAAGYDKRLLDAAVHTATLAGYAHLQPAEAPSLSLMRSFNSMADLVAKHARGKETADPDIEAKELFRRYGFSGASEFDTVIIDGVERGAFDDEELKAVLEKAEQAITMADKNKSFDNAWDRFQNNFQNNDGEVLDALAAAIRENYQAIRPAALSYTIAFLKDFDRTDEALEALSIYVSRRVETAGFWNLEDQTRSEAVTDPDVRAAFAKKFVEVSPPPPEPPSVLKDIAGRNGWNPEQISFLAALSVEDYINIFTNPQEDLSLVLPAALRFRNIVNATPDMQTITFKVEAALYRIATKSQMNAKRVKYWAFDVENYSAETNPYIQY